MPKKQSRFLVKKNLFVGVPPQLSLGGWQLFKGLHYTRLLRLLQNGFHFAISLNISRNIMAYSEGPMVWVSFLVQQNKSETTKMLMDSSLFPLCLSKRMKQGVPLKWTNAKFSLLTNENLKIEVPGIFLLRLFLVFAFLIFAAKLYTSAWNHVNYL